VIAVALAASANATVAGMAGPPAGPGGLTDSPPAQSQRAPGDGFFALLAAGLGIETACATPDAAGEPRPAAGQVDGMREIPGKPAAPARGRSKDQVNELACVAPSLVAERPLPVTCIRVLPANPQNETANLVKDTTSGDGRVRPGNSETPPAKPIAVDDSGVFQGDASDSAALPPQTAFEALIRAPNPEDVPSAGPTADPPAGAASPLTPAVPKLAATASAATPSPPSVTGPEPGARKAGESGVEPASVDSGQAQMTKPSANDPAPPNGQQQESPDEQKRVRDDGPDGLAGAIGSGRGDTPFALNAPSPPAAEPVPTPPPELQLSGDTAPAMPVTDTAATRAAASPARDISLQLPNPDGPRVDVQLTDRAGTVHVIVRTEDNGLARDLRTNLPELTQRLNQQGMDAEAWGPVQTHGAAGSRGNPGQPRGQSEGRSWSGGSQQGAGGNSQGGRKQFQGEGADEESAETFRKAFTGAISWQPVR